MLIPDFTDKSTRILTKDKCEEELARSIKELSIYKKEKAPKEKINYSEAKVAIWKRVLFHVNNCEIITINDKQEIHWLETSKIQVN